MGGDLALTVADDGIGLGPAEARRAGFGLTNMGVRAATLGGECEVRASDGGVGTVVEWRVPLGTASVQYR